MTTEYIFPYYQVVLNFEYELVFVYLIGCVRLIQEIGQFLYNTPSISRY